MLSMRITLKIFLDDPEIVQPDDFTPVFHAWIQKGTVEGLLLDVADYQHIQDGPGMILIGDQVDYAFDLGTGHSGLLVRRKFRGTARVSLREQVQDTLALALHACHALEIDPELQGKIAFRAGDVEIAFPDRFHVPNTPETFQAYAKELTPLLERLYSIDGIQIQHVSIDPREAFTVRVHVPESPGTAALIKQLESTVEGK